MLDPARVYVGGEITLAWDLIEMTVRAALAERALTPAAADTEIRPAAATRISAPARRRRARHGAGLCGASRGVGRIERGDLVRVASETGKAIECQMTGLGLGPTSGE